MDKAAMIKTAGKQVLRSRRHCLFFLVTLFGPAVRHSLTLTDMGRDQ